MAGLTSTFHISSKSQLYKPRKSFHLHLQGFCFRTHSPITTRCPSISTTVSARYEGGGASGRSSFSEDEALDISTIRSDTVRLIDEQQKMVGIVSKNEAFQMADNAELDLVILSPDADPPVVRIMDYNAESNAASRMDLKELKMGYNIDVHDYSVRLKAAQKFLKDGDKVKVIVNLKGREKEFRNNAIELIRRFQNDLGELAIEETKNFKDRNIFIVLIPNKAVALKSQEPPKKKDSKASKEQLSATA